VKRSTILYLAAAGVVAYFYGFPTNGLSHFDEGQYAFARVWPWIDQFDVQQAFFSPPLYPFLVGLVQHLPITRPDLAGVYISWIACWVSLYLGVKLAVAWWGRAAAFPAFVLLLLSPMRLAFGTIGLTDALFSALVLATLLAATKAFHSGSTSWTILTGLLAGSTWNCKYNGFITLAIIAGFLLHQRTVSSFVRWLVISLIAVAMIVPWFWAIQTHHPEGIAALQKHQQGYVRGISPGVVWENLRHLLTVRSDVPGFSVLIVSWSLLGVAMSAASRWVACVLLALLLTGEESSFSRLFPILSVLILPCSIIAAKPNARWPVLFAMGFTAFVPGIYTPYLRLWLPAEHFMMIVLAGAIVGVEQFVKSMHSNRIAVGAAAALILVPSVLKVLVPASALFRISIPETWYVISRRFDDARPRMRPVEGYRLAVENLVGRVKANDADRLLVYARPPLLFYLAHSDLHVPVQRLPDERFQWEQFPSGSILVTDIAVRDARDFSKSPYDGKRRRWLQRTDGFWVAPHPLTVLDDFGVFDLQLHGEYKVNLYLIAPFSGSNP
jgi:hypothetical protein